MFVFRFPPCLLSKIPFISFYSFLLYNLISHASD
nr:MAG TPA: hypothetical protein [Caudoviricetes sp.]